MMLLQYHTQLPLERKDLTLAMRVVNMRCLMISWMASLKAMAGLLGIYFLIRHLC